MNGDDLFEAFDTVIKNPHKFKNDTDRQNVETLYFKLVELSSVSEQMGEDGVFNETQTAILDIYYMIVYMEGGLHEHDDLFKCA